MSTNLRNTLAFCCLFWGLSNCLAQAKDLSLMGLNCELALGTETSVPEALVSFVRSQVPGSEALSAFDFERAEGWRRGEGKAFLWASRPSPAPSDSRENSDPQRRLHIIYQVDLDTGEVDLIHFDSNISAFKIVGNTLYVAEYEPGNRDLEKQLSKFRGRFKVIDVHEAIRRYPLDWLKGPSDRKIPFRTVYLKGNFPWAFKNQTHLERDSRIIDFEIGSHTISIRRAFQQVDAPREELRRQDR